MVTYLLAGLWAATAGPDRLPSRRRLPAAWPAAAAAIAIYVYLDDLPLPLLAGLGLAVTAAAPVALVQESPLIAWRIAALATLITVPVEVAPAGTAWPWHPVQVLILVGAVFAVALRHRGVVAGWVAVISAVAMVARVSSADAITVVVLLAVAAVTGAQVRRRVRARLVAEQTRQALREQRSRLARELHDVAGHHMSLIAVRAESAPYRLDRQFDAQQAEFTAIARASRDALDDMRRLVGTLRDEDSAAGPGLADVRVLVGRVVAAGPVVDLDLEPAVEQAAADPRTGLAVYRIVQEALSNVTRHAPGCAARVAVWRDGDGIRVRVHNDAATGGGRGSYGGGHGLRGLRERVVALGGTLTAGPCDGGYRLEAILPRCPAGRSRIAA